MRSSLFLLVLFSIVASQEIRRTLLDGTGPIAVYGTSSGVFTIERIPGTIGGEGVGSFLTVRCLSSAFNFGVDSLPLIINNYPISTLPPKFVAHCAPSNLLYLDVVNNAVAPPKNLTFVFNEVAESDFVDVGLGAVNSTTTGSVLRFRSLDGVFRSIPILNLGSTTVSEVSLNYFASNSASFPPSYGEFTYFWLPANVTGANIRLFSPNRYAVVSENNAVTANTTDYLYGSEVPPFTCAVWRNATSQESKLYSCTTFENTAVSYKLPELGSYLFQTLPTYELGVDVNATRGDLAVASSEKIRVAQNTVTGLIYFNPGTGFISTPYVLLDADFLTVINYAKGNATVRTLSASYSLFSLTGQNFSTVIDVTGAVRNLYWVRLQSQEFGLYRLSTTPSAIAAVFSQSGPSLTGTPTSTFYLIGPNYPLWIQLSAPNGVLRTSLNVTFQTDFLDVDLTSTRSQLVTVVSSGTTVMRIKIPASDRCIEFNSTTVAPPSTPFLTVIKSNLFPTNIYSVCKSQAAVNNPLANTYYYPFTTTFQGFVRVSRITVEDVTCGQTVTPANDNTPIIYSLPNSLYRNTIISDSTAGLDWSLGGSNGNLKGQLVVTTGLDQAQPIMRFVQRGGTFTIPNTCSDGELAVSCSANPQCPSSVCMSNGDCMPVPTTSTSLTSSFVRPSTSRTSQGSALVFCATIIFGLILLLA